MMQGIDVSLRLCQGIAFKKRFRVCFANPESSIFINVMHLNQRRPLHALPYLLGSHGRH